MMGMSAADVTKSDVISVGDNLDWRAALNYVDARELFSRVHKSGLRHRTYSIMLNWHPWRTELRIETGLDV
jgi:hypothetical protein